MERRSVRPSTRTPSARSSTDAPPPPAEPPSSTCSRSPRRPLKPDPPPHLLPPAPLRQHRLAPQAPSPRASAKRRPSPRPPPRLPSRASRTTAPRSSSSTTAARTSRSSRRVRCPHRRRAGPRRGRRPKAQSGARREEVRARAKGGRGSRRRTRRTVRLLFSPSYASPDAAHEADVAFPARSFAHPRVPSLRRVDQERPHGAARRALQRRRSTSDGVDECCLGQAARRERARRWSKRRRQRVRPASPSRRRSRRRPKLKHRLTQFCCAQLIVLERARRRQARHDSPFAARELRPQVGPGAQRHAQGAASFLSFVLSFHGTGH